MVVIWWDLQREDRCFPYDLCVERLQVFQSHGSRALSTQREVLCSAIAGEEEMDNGVFFMCLNKGLLIFCSD